MIFATAYVLTIVGCAKASSGGGGPAPVQVDVQPAAEDIILQPLDPKDLRECNNDEFSDLIAWSNDLAVSDESIKTSEGRNNPNTVKLAVAAIKKCDAAEFYHTNKPCKKTKIKRDITTPEKSVTTVTAYDAYRIKQRCQRTEDYLNKYKLRPSPSQIQPEPVRPTDPVKPSVNPPAQPVTPDAPVGQYRQCTANEFSQLNAWRASLDKANKNVARLGNQSSWKFDALALDSTSAATKSCETLIAYHQAQPCQREKTYTAEILREQCATVRTYYYNFAQRTESLIMPNAKLYFNTNVLKNRSFEPGPAALSLGQCVITNQTSENISYSGQKTLVKAARVYTDSLQMFAMETEEGLKFECYGLAFESAATSLNEVMRLLSAKDTQLPLSYELN